MCGIAGLIVPRRAGAEVQTQVLARMATAMAHRGPDGSGTWVSANHGVGLAHTRLAIVDLSPTGAQPLHSNDGRLHIVFNGEIYNHIELRKTLEKGGHQFRGTSDTEVLLAAFETHGIDCLDMLDGMFAFAIVDDATNQTWLARDPLGEKPLYTVEKPRCFAFASEVSALVSSGLASSEPDITGIAHLLRQGSIPPPWTHLRDVSFLEPGTWHQVDASAQRVSSRRYWTLPFNREAETIQDHDEATSAIRDALRRSVSLRGRADVPVGAFLSGGLDSTVVCAILAEAGFTNLEAFTVTLPGHPNDEGDAAKEVAAHLGIRHTQVPVDVEDGAWLEQAIASMDVPSIDGVNTWLVSRAASQAGLKVACTGLGGDELFFGYPTFRLIPRLSGLSPFFRPFQLFHSSLSAARNWTPAIPRISRLFDAALAGGSTAALWFAKRGLYSDAEVRNMLTEAAYKLASSANPTERIEGILPRTDLDPARRVSVLELSVYMHDQLLRDTDCMSMHHSLEVRVPLLARPLVETVARISTKLLEALPPKRLLRDSISDLIPHHLLSRPKQGFTLDWSHLSRTLVTMEHQLPPEIFRPLKDFELQSRPGIPPYLVLTALAKCLSNTTRSIRTSAGATYSNG